MTRSSPWPIPPIFICYMLLYLLRAIAVPLAYYAFRVIRKDLEKLKAMDAETKKIDAQIPAMIRQSYQTARKRAAHPIIQQEPTTIERVQPLGIVYHSTIDDRHVVNLLTRYTFTDLPPEIRNQIFHLAIPNRETIHLASPTENAIPAICRLNRQIRRETTPIFLANKIFDVSIESTASLMKTVAWLTIVQNMDARMFNMDIKVHNLSINIRGRIQEPIGIFVSLEYKRDLNPNPTAQQDVPWVPSWVEATRKPWNEISRQAQALRINTYRPRGQYGFGIDVVAKLLLCVFEVSAFEPSGLWECRRLTAPDFEICSESFRSHDGESRITLWYRFHPAF